MNVPTVIQYTQGTNDIKVRFEFVDIQIRETQKIYLYAQKPSGHKIYNEAEEVNVNEGYAVFAVTNQMSAEAGRNVMQLRITEHEKVINSFLILFDVASGIYDEDAILSSNEYKALDQALDSAREWENAAEKSAAEAKKYSDNAGVYATNAKTSEINAKTHETSTKASEANAKTSEANAKVSEMNAKTSETNALVSESNASASASSAKISETNAKTSEAAAKASEVNASISEANALEYSNNSSDSADASESSAVTSSTYASYSENSAKAAKSSEDKALEYSIVANNSAEEAKSSENNAREHSKDASDSAEESMSYALQAQSYAVGTGGVRDNESEDNSKFYSEKSKEYMNTWKGSLLPKGSVAFENLPTNDIMPGYLYNISNRFVSDDRFKDGLGYSYPAGTNIYYTEDGKWDVLYGILTKEITQAEYDALSESQKKNGTIYYIKDADVEIGSASDSVPGVVLVDSALSSSSKNPVQNKVVTEALNKKLNDSDISSWAKGSTKPTYTASEVGAYTKAETDTELNRKANSLHEHGNEDIISLDASKIVSGIISIDRLPQGALERLIVVADDTARFKLTSSNVQKGDTVKVTSTGKMYYVVDETKLSSEAGYEVYAAGTAASVPWSGVTGKPNTYTPSEHTHTKSQVMDFPTSMPANGGNSDTVNNHTVETDVPTDAKFTDTVYDDTEVKESIAELSSNLDGLEFGEVAGGKNVLNYDDLVDGDYDSTNKYIRVTVDFDKRLFVKSGTSVAFSFTPTSKVNLIWLAVVDANNTLIEEIIIGATINTVANVTKDGYLTPIFGGTDSSGDWSNITVNDVIECKPQIEFNNVVTEYEPYIPSVKMLAEENIQQSNSMVDLKMLGWSVPKECPIQNEVSGNQFIQKVGRIDLGILTWLKYTPVSGVFMTSYSDLKINGYIYADGFVYYTPSWIESSPNKCIAIHPSLTNIYIKDTTYTDVESFKNSVIGKYAYYELATPITMTIDGNEVTERINDSLGEYDINENATSSYSKSNGFAIEWIKMCKATKGTYKLSYTINGSTGNTSEIALGKAIDDKSLYCNNGIISDGIYEQIINITSDTDVYIMAYTNGSFTISDIKFTLQNIANEVGNLKNDLTNIKNGTTKVGNADTLDGNHASDFVKFKSITQAEYDKLTSPESNVIYFITDAS